MAAFGSEELRLVSAEPHVLSKSGVRPSPDITTARTGFFWSSTRRVAEIRASPARLMGVSARVSPRGGGVAPSTPTGSRGSQGRPESGRGVHHFGPDPAYVGGIGSVIRLLSEHSVAGASVRAHPTWRPGSRMASCVLAARAALALGAVRRQDIVHVHLAENGAFLREGAIVWAAALLGKTTVVTIHGSGFIEFSRRHPGLAGHVLARADLITCLDSGVLARVRELVPRTHVELLANPVAIPEDTLDAASTEEIVLFAGEIGKRKGADVLARAWPTVLAARPQARCVMVGPVGDLQIPGLPGLETREAVPPDQLHELIRSSRVIALPSRAEGLPMILTEAMSHARPFVSTPVGGIPELATAGGMLVPVGDERTLAECLLRVLGDRELASAVGRRGRAFCVGTRSLPVISCRLEELYMTAQRLATGGR